MSDRLKKIFNVFIVSIINIVYGFFVFYLLPTLLLLAFNKTKGVGNNPDGKLFILPAWFAIISIIVMLFIINWIVIKKSRLNKKYYIISAISLILGAIIGIAVTNSVYYVNYTNILKELGL